MEGIANISRTVSAGQDEEVWVELMSYRDCNHLKEHYEKSKNNRSIDGLWQNLSV